VTPILIIAAAALIGEVLVALLAGRLLDYASEPGDFAEKTILVPRQSDANGSAGFSRRKRWSPA
jgi:hypothetical protein